MSVVKAQVTICPDMNFAEGTVLTSNYQSHCNLRSSALVLFAVTANYVFKIPASGTDLKSTGILPASAKLAVKYRPGR